MLATFLVRSNQARIVVGNSQIEPRREPMIIRITISNFRCFRQLDVEGLKRINLIVGKNSSGKSAFLESIFLSCGSLGPGTVFQIRGIRRMGNNVIFPNDAMTYRSLWEDLFYNFDHENPVSIKIGGQPNAESRTLRIAYTATSETREISFDKSSSFGASARTLQSVGMPQIEFNWKRSGQQAIIAKPRFTQTGMQIDAPADFFPCVWFTPSIGESIEENAKRFSELDKRGAIDTVVSVLSHEFPFIEGLSIDYHAGLPMVFASLKDSSRKQPVPLVSDGVNRLLGICLGIATYAGGVVLIDQIEDGFHHTLLPSIWSSIYTLANDLNVQVFVSTHSAECLAAMKPVVAEHDSDFTLLRASRISDGCELRMFDGKYLETALEQDFEVR